MGRRIRKGCALLAGAALLAAAGCGGSSAPRYSGSALRSCFEQSGESIIRFAAMPAAERAPLTGHLPGGFGVQFISGEFALFYVGQNAHAAESARAWLTKERVGNRAGRSLVVMSVNGDLFALLQAHPTLATQETVARCRSSARI
jgi:hypothetical protein